MSILNKLKKKTKADLNISPVTIDEVAEDIEMLLAMDIETKRIAKKYDENFYSKPSDIAHYVLKKKLAELYLEKK